MNRIKPPVDADKFQAQNPAMANRKKISKAQMQKNISAFHGIFKQKPGEKSVVQELLEERRDEKEKEDHEFKPLEKEIKINWLAK